MVQLIICWIPTKCAAKGGINTEFIDDVDLIPDPVEFDERKKNVLVLDDVLLGPQNKIEDMYTRGRHNGIDTFYIAQNYFKIPRQTVRENSNLIVMFPQDMKNLNHIYNDHCAGDGISCQQFQDFCSKVWRSGKHKYVILDLSRDVNNGKYRTSLRNFWNPEKKDEKQKIRKKGSGMYLNPYMGRGYMK